MFSSRSFIVSGFKFSLGIQDELVFPYCERHGFNFALKIHEVLPSPFVEELILIPLYGLSNPIKN